MLSVTSESLIETQALAEVLGRSLTGGEVIELISDIGGGKTTFVKGLARGLSIGETIQSPTFTISRLYNGRDGLELHHFDFYRLTEGGVAAESLSESLTHPKAIVAIEWGDIVHDVLPHNRATLKIESIADDVRRLIFEIPETYAHLQAALEQYKAEWGLA